MATKLKDNVKIGTQMYEQYQVVAKDGLIAIAKAYLIAHGTPNPSATQITAQENKYKRYAKRDKNNNLVDPPNGTYDKTTVAEIKAKGSIYTGEILLLPYTADVIPPVVPAPVSTKSVSDRLKELEDSKKYLTDAEYKAKKQEILSTI